MTSVLRAQLEGSGSRKCYADTSLPSFMLVKGKARTALELKLVIGELSVAGKACASWKCGKYSVQTPWAQVCVSLAFGMPVLS